MMKNLPMLFLGIFFTLAFSWTGLILSSQVPFRSGESAWGRLSPTTERLIHPQTEEPIAGVVVDVEREDGRTVRMEGLRMPGEPLFPQAPVGLAESGKAVYISMGCMYCHSQQVRHQGFGNDIERGWGLRGSVPRDYILQDRVLLGTMRTGPDLASVGTRFTGEGGIDWHHSHLWDPQITSPGSIMPPYRFLYRVISEEEAGDQYRVRIPSDHPQAPPAGYVVVPRPEAHALVAYLLSLRIDYSLPEAPIVE